MAYSTQSDLLGEISEAELAQLTSDADGVIDALVVASAINDADAEIDGYVAVRYAVPLSPVPALIKKFSTKIALYNLFSRRSNRLGGVDETVAKNRDNAVAALKEISRGTVTLGVDPAPEQNTAGGFKSSADERDFTKDNLKGF